PRACPLPPPPRSGKLPQSESCAKRPSRAKQKHDSQRLSARLPPQNCLPAFCATLPQRLKRCPKLWAGVATASMPLQELNTCCVSCFQKSLDYCCRQAKILEKRCSAPRAICCLQGTTVCCWSTAIAQHYLPISWFKQLKRCAIRATGWSLGPRATAATTSSALKLPPRKRSTKVK